MVCHHQSGGGDSGDSIMNGIIQDSSASSCHDDVQSSSVITLLTTTKKAAGDTTTTTITRGQPSSSPREKLVNDGQEESPRNSGSGGGGGSSNPHDEVPPSTAGTDATTTTPSATKTTIFPSPSSTSSSISTMTTMMIRGLYFTYHGSLGAVIPFITVYHASLGYTGTQIGLLSAIRPLVSFLLSPIWGRILLCSSGSAGGGGGGGGSDDIDDSVTTGTGGGGGDNDDDGDGNSRVATTRRRRRFDMNNFVILQLTIVLSATFQVLTLWCHHHHPQSSTSSSSTTTNNHRDIGIGLVSCTILTATFASPVKSLLDATVLGALALVVDGGQQDGGDGVGGRNAPAPVADYGKLRLWGQLGFGVVCIIVGNMVSSSPTSSSDSGGGSSGGGGTKAVADYNYSLAFFVHGLMALPSILLIRMIERQCSCCRRRHHHQAKQQGGRKKETGASSISNSTPEPPPSSKVSSSSTDDDGEEEGTTTDVVVGVGGGFFSEILRSSPDVIIFFWIVLLVGVSTAVSVDFTYVRIRELGGSSRDIGYCRSVTSITGMLAFYYSKELSTLTAGRDNNNNKNNNIDQVLMWTILAYSLRFYLYGKMMTSGLGWEILLGEAIRGCAFGTFWTSATVYTNSVSPPGMNATMLMFLGAMYEGLGQTIGSLVGGKLQSILGTSKMFHIFAIFNLALAAGLVLLRIWRASSSATANGDGNELSKPLSKINPRPTSVPHTQRACSDGKVLGLEKKVQ